jgi:hypothetical protein
MVSSGKSITVTVRILKQILSYLQCRLSPTWALIGCPDARHLVQRKTGHKGPFKLSLSELWKTAYTGPLSHTRSNCTCVTHIFVTVVFVARYWLLHLNTY